MKVCIKHLCLCPRGLCTDIIPNLYPLHTPPFQFDQGGLTLNAMHYSANNSDEVKDAYIEYYTEVAKLLGADGAKARDVAEQVWDLETQLAEVGINQER